MARWRYLLRLECPDTGLIMCGFVLAASEFATVAILILVAIGVSGAMMIFAHVLGPKRHGPIKDDTYESGIAPATDARRRFNVRFYLIAVMYVVFGVEVVFLYPWAVLFTQEREALTEYVAAEAAGTLDQASEAALWAGELTAAGYGPGFMLGAILVFFALLAVGFAYEWRKGIFRWD